jgi:hypothetical protein
LHNACAFRSAQACHYALQWRHGQRNPTRHCTKSFFVENRSPLHYKNSLIDIQADLIISFKFFLKLTVMVFP